MSSAVIMWIIQILQMNASIQVAFTAGPGLETCISLHHPKPVDQIGPINRVIKVPEVYQENKATMHDAKGLFTQRFSSA